MKKLTKQLVIVAIIATVFSACGPSAEDILKKYDAYGELQTENRKSNVYFEIKGTMPMISYSLPLLNTNGEFVKTLAGRWFVADAENPGVKLPVNVGLTTINATINGIAQPVTYGHMLSLDDIKARFLLIGFEGIGSAESEEAEIPPLFFLVENKKGIGEALTVTPRLADSLFAASYEPTRFVNYSTLTVRGFNLKTDPYLNISFHSLTLTDEKGLEITVPDLDKWFENARLKKSVISKGAITVSFNGTGAETVTMAKDGKVVGDFEIGEKVYPVSLSVGSQVFTEKTADGKYKLLPEETAKLASETGASEKSTKK